MIKITMEKGKCKNCGEWSGENELCRECYRFLIGKEED